MKTLHVTLVLLLSLLGSLEASSITLGGVVRSENQKTITSRYMGFVQDVLVEEGSMVKKGDVLYTIDSKEIDTAKAQAELAIAQADLNEQMYANQYKNAMLNLERYQRLLAKDMVSKFDVENLELSASNLKAMMDIAQKQRLQAKQKLQEVQNQYRYLHVRAPNDGVVIEKQIKAGEMALPGVSTLILSDLSSLKVLVEVSESQLSTMKIGEYVDVHITSIGFKVEGTIAAIVPAVHAQSHTFKVKIAFTPTAFVYPGMYTEVVFKGKNP